MADYVHFLNQNQRIKVAEDLQRELPKLSQTDPNHATLSAIGEGLAQFLKATGHPVDGLEKLINKNELPPGFSDEMATQLSVKDEAWKRFKRATEEFVTLSDDGKRYILHEDKRAAFEKEMANHNPDSLLTYAIGLKGTPRQEFGEKLALALSASDTTGAHRMLGTVNPAYGAPKDNRYGALYFAQEPDAQGGFSKEKVRKVLDDWDNPASDHRSHQYVYQPVDNIKDLIPESGSRDIWHSIRREINFTPIS